MMDIIEYMEAHAEKTLDDITKGLPAGKFRCACGNVADLSGAVPSTPSPYSLPMCGECFDRWREENVYLRPH